MLMLMTVLAAAVAAPPAPVAAPMACPRVEVRQADEGPRRRLEGRRRAVHVSRDQVFSAREVGDLEFLVTYPRPLAEREIELRLLTPSGNLYQKLRLPLPALRRHDPWGQASVSLPVSGTLIEKSALFGVWTVQPAVAATPLDCRRPERFTLER